MKNRHSNLVLLAGAIILAINLVYIQLRIKAEDPMYLNTHAGMIQIIANVIVLVCIYFLARIYEKIQREKEEYRQALAEKTKELEEMTMQTITATAGTIDAKDSY